MEIKWKKEHLNCFSYMNIQCIHFDWMKMTLYSYDFMIWFGLVSDKMRWFPIKYAYVSETHVNACKNGKVFVWDEITNYRQQQ